MLYFCSRFPLKSTIRRSQTEQMVDLAQLVRVPDCGSVGRGFESHIPPREEEVRESLFFYCIFPHFVEKYVLLHL